MSSCIFQDSFQFYMSDYLWNDASFPYVVGKQFLGCFHVVVQAVKICLGKQMMWVWLKETVHFMDLLERFSANIRDVHPVKTAWICLRKQVQESVSHAGCLDTCSGAQMWPD